jgi:hypothetical protein
MIDAIARYWRKWRGARRSAEALACCGAETTGMLAHDVGVSTSELRSLAGKWPEATPLLSGRLAALNFQERAIRTSEPAVLGDLQRVCSQCTSTQDCTHDLARNPSDPVWQVYCPNAVTLEALVTERAQNGADRFRSAG